MWKKKKGFGKHKEWEEMEENDKKKKKWEETEEED